MLSSLSLSSLVSCVIAGLLVLLLKNMFQASALFYFLFNIRVETVNIPCNSVLLIFYVQSQTNILHEDGIDHCKANIQHFLGGASPPTLRYVN